MFETLTDFVYLIAQLFSEAQKCSADCMFTSLYLYVSAPLRVRSYILRPYIVDCDFMISQKSSGCDQQNHCFGKNRHKTYFVSSSTKCVFSFPMVNVFVCSAQAQEEVIIFIRWHIKSTTHCNKLMVARSL